MSEYLHVEKPFLDQLASLGWTVIDQVVGIIPSDPSNTCTADGRLSFHWKCMILKTAVEKPKTKI